MSSNRREFLTKAAITAAGIGALSGTQEKAAAASTVSRRVSALMARFGLKYPIFSAGMGGTAVPDLVIAVTNAGGLGALGTGRNPVADVVRKRVLMVRSATKRPFAVNFLLAAEPVTLSVALDAGAPIIQFAWGIPTVETVAAIRAAGAMLGIQVGSAAGAQRAVEVGADYIICQGIEAGGHVQSTYALYDVLPAVIDAAGSVPVLAAGGISNGMHIKRALLVGASGVLMGTRFVATREAGSHEEYKSAIIRATATDTVLTVCFQDGWANAPHRALRNRTVELWEAAGCPPPGRRPGEGDILATNSITGEAKRRYSAYHPLSEDRGAVTEMALWAGQGVDAIRDIPSVGEMMERLWREYLEAS